MIFKKVYYSMDCCKPLLNTEVTKTKKTTKQVTGNIHRAQLGSPPEWTTMDGANNVERRI